MQANYLNYIMNKEGLTDKMKREQQNIQQRVQKSHLWGPLLGAFGLVSLLYGFEKLLDRTALVDQPWTLVLLGVFLLLLTGSFYNKL